MEKNEKFLKLLDTLNVAQREAVETVEGAVMVIAGPGTGKTQILTLRIANILLRTDVNPENILALTFTESGVYAMRKRLVSMIGTPGYRVGIYTFHGFCNELIQNNPEEFAHLISAEAAMELDQIGIVEEFIKGSEELRVLKPFGDPLYYVKPALGAISDLKQEGVTVEKFEAGILREEADFERITDLYHEKGAYKGRMKSVYEKQLKNIEKNKELVLIYKAYQEGLKGGRVSEAKPHPSPLLKGEGSKRKRLYDFNDMLLEVIKVLDANPDFLLRLQEQYQYFLVDEHQDTNAAQNHIVELLCNFYPNPNLFVVGDEKQAIYRFAGATLENFLYFQKLYPEAVLIRLTDNYRSSQTILDASGSVMQDQRSKIKDQKLEEELERVDKSHVGLVARAGHAQERVKVVAANDFYSEYYFVGEEIAKRVKSGVVGAEVAILGKENKDLLPFVDVFDRLGIAYTIESNQNLLAEVEIEKLLLLFSVVANLGVDGVLIRAMHIDCLGISPVDIYRLIQVAKEKKVGLWDFLGRLSRELGERSKIKDQKSKVQFKSQKLQEDGEVSEKLESEDSISKVEGDPSITLRSTRDDMGIGLVSGEKVLELYGKVVRWKSVAYNQRFDYFFKVVLEESGFLQSLLRKRNAMALLDKVTGLYEEVKGLVERDPGFSLEDFMAYLQLIEEHEVKITKAPKTIRRDAVRLMTAHRSKGLEFDYVYIINAFDKHWGNSRKRGSGFSLAWEYLMDLTPSNSLPLSSRRAPNVRSLSGGEKERFPLSGGGQDKEERNEDERRLFYVALTRARKEVMISYSTLGREGKEQVVSQFVDEISEEYREGVDISAFEGEFLENKQVILAPGLAEVSDIKAEYLGNKDYFTELFRMKGFSVSHLNNYLACPWRYFFRNLVEIPEPMQKTAMYGLAVHKALNEYLKKDQRSKIKDQKQGVLFDDLVVEEPKDTVAEGLEVLMDAFARALAEQPLSRAEYEELWRKGKKALSGYYSMYMLEWKDNLLGEFPIRGIRLSDDVTLTGRLDMIELVGDSGEVVVYDFKTGKPKSRGDIEGTTKNGSGDYKRQLVFYKLLLDRYQVKKMKMSTGVIDFIEPSDKGDYKREVFSITDADVADLEQQILEVTREILDFGFWDKGCGKADCAYCRLREYIGK